MPLMVGHRLMATSLLFTGDIAPGRAHYDRAMSFYNPAEHRRSRRDGQDVRVDAVFEAAASDLFQRWPGSKRVNSSCAEAQDETLVECVDLAP